MAYKTPEELKARFEGGDVPTQQDFADFIESTHQETVLVRPTGIAATDTANMQAALDSNPDGVVLALEGTHLWNEVITKPTGCSLLGTGIGTILKAASGFPATHTAYSKTFDAPLLYCDNTSSTKISNTGRFLIDGDSLAANGMLISKGADHEYGNIRVQNTTINGFVLDAAQNNLYRKLWTFQAGTRSYYVINGTYNNSFIGCDSRSPTVADLETANDVTYPGFGIVSGVDGMSNCTWIGGILEDAVATKTHVVLMTEGRQNTFVGTQLEATKVTTGTIETGANAGFNNFIGLNFFGGGVELPAIIDRGFENVYRDDNFTFYGTTTLADLIEVYNRAAILHPKFNSNINVTGKHIVNKSGSPTSSTVVIYEPFLKGGSTGSRPTIDIDANYDFWDTTLQKTVTWDFVTDTWRAQDGLAADEQTYTDGDTTPDVTGTRYMEIANTAPTTITNFDGEVIGQRILLSFKDGNTTIQSGTSVRLAGGVNFVASADDTLELVKERLSPFALVEVGRSVNAP